MAKKIALLVSAGKIGAYKTKSPSPISIEDIDFIMKNLDFGLEQSWGYDINKLAEKERDFTRGKTHGLK